MTKDTCPRVSSSESDSSTTKQRKRRKWDQPDESLVSAGVAVHGIFPLANMGSLTRITLPSVQAVSGASLVIPFSASNANPLQVVQTPLQQQAVALVQKLIQPKVQDELIAREIVINDADSAIRYKLTKRQTQDEIQRCTGAVVITRGKYRPPNALPDGERPLYLHISASAHLETTAERIKAVDCAAAMVEETLKQASMNNGVKVDHLLSARVYLGFEADPSLNIASHICGPNDQYVNHIMNETGATVLVRGRGSGSENEHAEEAQQPLHLLLSSNDLKSLERAKLLTENLLDTVSKECGASRLSSNKVYGAVPPPPMLQALGSTPNSNNIATSSSTPLTGLTSCISYGQTSYTASYPHGPLTINGTSYIGYKGIYPKCPLQQVALALRQSTSVNATAASSTTTIASTEPSSDAPQVVKDKRPQKRKFKELLATGNGFDNHNQKNLQGSEFPIPHELTSHVGARDISVMQAPKTIQPSSSSAMPPPPPRSVSPPPPPPKFSSSNEIRPLLPRNISPPGPPPKFSSTPKLHGDKHEMNKSKPEHVPDTLVKLMEYGDDDDDDDLEETGEQLLKDHSSVPAMHKPFWAA